MGPMMPQRSLRRCKDTKLFFKITIPAKFFLDITVFENILLHLHHEFYKQKQNEEMKKGIHPENYRLVAFKDMSNDHVFLCRSAVSTKETIEVNGETYPVYKMEISNTSHPFYTGKMKLVDTAGRVDKFMSRYAKRYDKKNAAK
jgi:large subunit ribosomal protein L31